MERPCRYTKPLAGDSLSPITDAVRRSDRIVWIHTRHEETAAFAAGAEAQLSGQLAVCAGSCGPGHVHLINGLFDAQRSMARVLAIAAHIPSGEIGTSYFQETHPDRLFAECSHFSELISNPGQMPRTFQIAMQNAISKQGVAVVAVSGDIAARPMPDGAVSHPPIKEPPVTRPSAASLEALAKLLNDARHITLFCGSGCAGAHDELLALAETLKAPIAYALRGKHFVEYDNPYEIGMTGLIGGRAAYHATSCCCLAPTFRTKHSCRRSQRSPRWIFVPITSGAAPGSTSGFWGMCTRPSRRCFPFCSARTTARISMAHCANSLMCGANSTSMWTTSVNAGRFIPSTLRQL
jgi:pyruvate dehydrogenase (quinone)